MILGAKQALAALICVTPMGVAETVDGVKDVPVMFVEDSAGEEGQRLLHKRPAPKAVREEHLGDQEAPQDVEKVMWSEDLATGVGLMVFMFFFPLLELGTSAKDRLCEVLLRRKLGQGTEE